MSAAGLQVAAWRSFFHWMPSQLRAHQDTDHVTTVLSFPYHLCKVRNRFSGPRWVAIPQCGADFIFKIFQGGIQCVNEVLKEAAIIAPLDSRTVEIPFELDRAHDEASKGSDSPKRYPQGSLTEGKSCKRGAPVRLPSSEALTHRPCRAYMNPPFQAIAGALHRARTCRLRKLESIRPTRI